MSRMCKCGHAGHLHTLNNFSDHTLNRCSECDCQGFVDKYDVKFGQKSQEAFDIDGERK